MLYQERAAGIQFLNFGTFKYPFFFKYLYTFCQCHLLMEMCAPKIKMEALELFSFCIDKYVIVLGAACMEVLLLWVRKYCTISMPNVFYMKSTRTPKQPTTKFLKGYLVLERHDKQISQPGWLAAAEIGSLFKPRSCKYKGEESPRHDHSLQRQSSLWG